LADYWTRMGTFSVAAYRWIGSRTKGSGLGSFDFTLKNSHNLAARKFSMKAGHRFLLFGCDSSDGPTFCGSILRYDNCHARAENLVGGWGRVYARDTAQTQKPFLWVRSVSQSRKLKPSRSQTNQPFYTSAYRLLRS
jgi:hypothetical protein